MLAIRHIRTRPYTPKTNGKAERFIQTLMREWAYAIPFRSSETRAADLPRWITWYWVGGGQLKGEEGACGLRRFVAESL